MSISYGSSLNTFRSIRKRVRIATVIVSLAFTILIIRLWFLQIIEGPKYKLRSENNRIQIDFLPPPRGHILDRFGRPIVINRPSFSLELIPENLNGDIQNTINKLAKILDRPEDQLKSEFYRSRTTRRRYQPLVVARDLSRLEVAKLMVERFRLPGVNIAPVPTRDYLHDSLAAHVIGYTREISEEQLKRAEFITYRPDDIVGTSGIEGAFEEFIQGVRGSRRVVVNASGWKVGEQSLHPEMIGNTVETTLNLELQKKVEAELVGLKGAVVAMDVNNGEILAMASSPAFNPNIFSKNLSYKEWDQLIKGHLLRNKAIQGSYPPGSIFKPLVAIAGLKKEIINPDTKIYCPGYYYFGKRPYRCWKRSGHGQVDLLSALKVSCDVYFYHLGHKLNIDNINQIATDFGLGLATKFDLRGESAGLMPSRDWKRKYFSKPADKIWFPGETLSVAIGQGAVTVTPLQIARTYAALVNGGKLVTPRVVKRIISQDGHVIASFDGDKSSTINGIDKKHLNLINNGLTKVVNEVGGTGGKAKLDPELNITAGGKTGTAQVVDLKHHGKLGVFEDHAWFVGYAPVQNPSLVLAVLIENGGHGGAAAAPISKNIMDYYFKNLGHKIGTP